MLILPSSYSFSSLFLQLPCPVICAPAAILGVDFFIFPRSLAKTCIFGLSLVRRGALSSSRGVFRISLHPSLSMHLVSIARKFSLSHHCPPHSSSVLPSISVRHTFVSFFFWRAINRERKHGRECVLDGTQIVGNSFRWHMEVYIHPRTLPSCLFHLLFAPVCPVFPPFRYPLQGSG